jgi:O-antigen biosynthesis protein
MEEVSILIPTYFGNKLVENCVGSILKNVKQPKIIVYKNDIGWLKACNKLMQDTSTDVIILNDDTFVVSDIVEEMRTLAYSDPKIGIVGGKALSPNGETVINYGIYVGPDGNTAHKYYGKQRHEVNSVETQKAVEGSCMYIKREVLTNVGLFDENYGMGYREEVDLCFRAREAGYKVVSCPTAEYIHFVSQTNGQLGITNDTFDYFMSKWGAKLKLGKV